MKDLYTLREEIHNKCLQLQAIERLLNQHIVEDLWELSEKEQKELLLKCAKTENILCLKHWVIQHPLTGYEYRTSRLLKEEARSKGIHNWSRKTKNELIEELIRYEEK